MSARLLLDLQREHAFNPTPPEAALGNLHVPFDTITGSRRCEQVLAETLRRGERVALIGPSGAGKSSVTAHVLNSFVQDLAPIRVRVGLEPPQVASDPAQFTRHLIRTTAKYVEAHRKASQSRQVTSHVRAAGATVGKRPVTVTVGGGVPWLHGELAVELGALVDPMGPSGQDILEQAQQILALLRAWQLRPVLVLDDTDHWLVRPGLPDPQELIAGFFGRVTRLIAENLSDAAAVIAVHTSYLSNQSYLDAAPFLESRVVLPEVPDAGGLGRILTYRAERVLELPTQPPITELVAADALSRLHAHYAATDHNLRGHLQIVHASLTHACDNGADVIGVAHVEQAID